MAPPVRRERALMLADVNLMAGPAIVTMVRMVAVISALHTCAHVLGYLTLAMGVLLVAL